MIGTNEKAFLDAVDPPAFRLLGVALRPFSLGHLILLSHLGNRFVVGDGAPNLLDLIQGAFVCSRPFAQAQAAVRGPVFRKWLRRCLVHLWGRQCLVRIGFLPLYSVSVPRMVQTFSDYVAAHCHGPEVAPNDARHMDRPQPGTPFLQFVRVTLMARLNYSRTEVMDVPWCEALHDVFAYWELDGRTHLVSDRDRDLWEAHKAALEKLSGQLDEIERQYGLRQ